MERLTSGRFNKETLGGSKELKRTNSTMEARAKKRNTQTHLIFVVIVLLGEDTSSPFGREQPSNKLGG